MRMGRDVYIAEGCRFYHPDRIVIEDDARFNIGALIYGSGGVWIGRHARIGPRCFIHSANHEISESELAFFERGYIYAPVRIGDNVLISANVSILPGSKIGDHTFIGCGAVVTRGEYPSDSRLLGVPAKSTVAEAQQSITAQPELLIYTQTETSYDLMRHLLSCLGLPQVGVSLWGSAIPDSVRSVLLVGEPAWQPDLPAELKIWSLAEGLSQLDDPEFPRKRIIRYAYAGRDGRSDANSKVMQSLFWLITRLEKSPDRLSIRELHEWLKLLSLIDMDATWHQATLSKILSLLRQKCPIGLYKTVDFNSALENPRQWASIAEKRVLERIYSPVWRFYTQAVVSIQLLQHVLADLVMGRNIKSLRNLPARFKAVSARVSANTVALRLATMEQAKDEGGRVDQITAVARNPSNGLELLAAAIFSHINGLAEESAKLHALLTSPAWAVPDVAFTKSKKNGAGFCFSPLTVAWHYLQASARQPGYQLPEFELIVEHAEPLTWITFENSSFISLDLQKVSRSLVDNWAKLHSAYCPSGAQFVLDEISYRTATRSLEVAWTDVFKKIQHAVNAPFVKVKPWPSGYKAAISIRYDVDRPVGLGRIAELGKLQAKYANAACATWYYFNEHPDIQAQSSFLLRYWQEIGIHAEQAEDTSPGLGITHHSAPTSDYWYGDKANQDLERSGARYGEFMASSLHTPRPAWHGEHGCMANIWLTPLHFPLEGSTRDVSLRYFDKLLPYFRGVLASGGHAIIGSHPDLNQNILIRLLKRENTKDVWFATVHDVVERCRRVMQYGEIFMTYSGSEPGLCANADIADLAIEYWSPGMQAPREFSLQMKAGKIRHLELSEIKNKNQEL